MKCIIFLILMFCVALPYKVLALRNPFSCAHVHGIPVGPSQQVATAKTKKSAISQALADDTADDSASEWHVIADKDGIVIMQHTDGSIREITIGT